MMRNRTTRTAALGLALGLAVLAPACGGKGEEPREAAPAPRQKEMFEILRERVAANPADTDSWFHLADVYERAGSYELEVEALGKVLALTPERHGAWIKLGGAYNRLERWQEAADAYARARELRPDDPVLLNNQAYTLGKLGRTAEQIEALRRAVERRPSYAAARYNLGVVLLRSGDRAGAERQLAELRTFDEGAAAALGRELGGSGAAR